MTKKIIHVNRHMIAANTKDGGNRPVLTIKSKGKNRYGREVIINGPSKMVYDGTALSCGARVWLETTADLEIVDECSYEEALERGYESS